MLATTHAHDPETMRDSGPRWEDVFSAGFRATRIPLLIADARHPDTPILFVNDAFTALTGYAPDEIVGRACGVLDGPETDRSTLERIRAALEAGEGIETEILSYRKDGTRFWNAVVISPVRGDGDDTLYYFASHSDVSRKKDAEAELSRTRALLEEQVARRTADLQAALDQKTALLHEVEHRVKNNLQVISSLVLLKARRLKDPGARDVLLNLAERISALSTVHRLLYPVGDVSRFDLVEFLTDLTDDLMTLVPAGQVDLSLAVEAASVSAAKAAPLALLLNELVSNALKHAYPDNRRGHLRVQVTKPEGSLCIVVEDDGVGIDGLMPHGDGFGKTLIDMLVRQLKAQIEWRDARPGTRVVITMPLDAEEAQF